MLIDAIGDEWPDTSDGWFTFAGRYELAADVADVLLTRASGRDALAAAGWVHSSQLEQVGWLTAFEELLPDDAPYLVHASDRPVFVFRGETTPDREEGQ